ncbi:homoserine O-acetyltransferase [Candidatus Pelagibacter ubique]|uniref:Homoserine O-acetyltransferase n=1 Tax=Pelagibacter ubique TaxID=198252 RepID=A0ABX1T350_PELUQ|nr:alpha/beta fold hydrolase [Candidatus Pelagibacter ubique]NMN67670.1 homoserine O-acetyltransferase [Candidatus Pelagibacter ubique]
MKKYQEFNLGNVKLLSGKILKSAKLVYKTYGKLNKDQSNVIVLPTFYTGTHIRNEGFIGKNRAINPNKYFIISINMFGNGLSSSPSNSNKLQRSSQFPEITLWDNIYCQHKLITEKLKIKKIALVTGWSMAGCQSYQWAAQYPNMVKAILPFCASAKTSIHNHVFLEGVKAALIADTNWNKGNYKKQPVAGLRAFGRVYAGWAFSQDFYRDKLYKKLGFNSAEDLLDNWAKDHEKNWDANDLLSKLKTWQLNNISSGPLYKGNYIKALQSIKAKTILMPCNQDLYFRKEDNMFEKKFIKRASLKPIDSPYGHCAANPGNDKNFQRKLDLNIAELLT